MPGLSSASTLQGAAFGAVPYRSYMPPKLRGEIAQRLAEVRDAHMSRIWPHGAVPTLSLYGRIADDTWGAFGHIDPLLGQAMQRDEAEPVSAFTAHFSTAANVFVAARPWVKQDGQGVSLRAVYGISRSSCCAGREGVLYGPMAA